MTTVPTFATGGIVNHENGSMFGSGVIVDDLVGSIGAPLPQIKDALQDSLSEQIKKFCKQGKEMKITIGSIR